MSLQNALFQDRNTEIDDDDDDDDVLHHTGNRFELNFVLNFEFHESK